MPCGNVSTTFLLLRMEIKLEIDWALPMHKMRPGDSFFVPTLVDHHTFGKYIRRQRKKYGVNKNARLVVRHTIEKGLLGYRVYWRPKTTAPTSRF